MSSAEIKGNGLGGPKSLAITLIIGGIIGWIGAFALTLERLHVAANPDATLSCDLNVFISCKSVMLTPQAKLFGFPNPLIGIAAFMAPILVGFGILQALGGANPGRFPVLSIFSASLTCLLIGGVMLVIYLGVLRLLKVPEVEVLAKPIKKLFGR